MTEEQNTYKFRLVAELSPWKCYLFGNRPGITGETK